MRNNNSFVLTENLKQLLGYFDNEDSRVIVIVIFIACIKENWANFFVLKSP